MTTYMLPPMRPELVVCPKSDCGASDRIDVHAHKKRQYICHACGKTFAETTGTLRYDLKHPAWLVVLVLTVLAYGCPVPAIVMAFGLDERTVADWQLKAGQHAKQVQTEVVCNSTVNLGQVPADELYTKPQAGAIWIATALTVFSRLWLWGAIGWERDEHLITPVIQQVRAAAKWGKRSCGQSMAFVPIPRRSSRPFAIHSILGNRGGRAWWCGMICISSRL